MSLYEIINMLTGLFESIVAFMLFGNYMERRDDIPKYIYIIGIMAVAIGINISNRFLSYSIINLICIVFIMFVAAYIIYKADLKTRIILSLASVLISTCSEIIVMFLISAVCSINKADAYALPQWQIMGIVLSKTLNLAIVKIVCLLSKKNTVKMPVSYWTMYITVFTVTLFTIYLIFSQQSDNRISYMSLFCAIGLLYSIIITLYLYEHMAMQAGQLKEKEVLETQYKEQVNHMRELMLAQEQISIYHDLSNHMLSLKSYMDNHSYEEGNNYLSKLIKETDLISNIVDTGNIVLDAIITAKRNVAKKNDIEFSADLQIPENLQIDSSDCCVILGNALDNAIEACERIPDNRYINMKMVYHDNILSCKITNPVLKKFGNNNLLKTTKSDPQNHGIGTKNIKRTLEKYKSVYRMEYESGEFVFSFIIYDIPIKL